MLERPCRLVPFKRLPYLCFRVRVFPSSDKDRRRLPFFYGDRFAFRSVKLHMISLLSFHEVSCNQLSSGELRERRDAEILFQRFGRQLVFHGRKRKRAIQPSGSTPSCPSHFGKDASSYSRPRHG